jgi:phosphohistidine phosphatase
MKRLLLLRHAKSAWDDPMMRDFDRPLNPRGHRAARRMGQWLRDSGLRIDLLVCSPALRTRQTLDDVLDAWGSTPDVRVDDSIYMASADALLALIHGCDAAVDTLMILGHNPGLEDLAMLLTAEGDKAALAQLASKYPTAALADISLPVDTWSEVDRRDGALDRFILPRMLDASLAGD